MSKTNKRTIAVFGGSRTKPGENDYAQAQQLGELLAKAGYAVMTGGYIGSMEAVSRGAAESGGHVIGVTCDEIEAWRPVQPNRWVLEERRYATLRERLFGLIDDCDAALALPGGPGTLAEIAMMWNHLLTGTITPQPLILIGEGWSDTFKQFYRSFDAYTPEEQRQWLLFAQNVSQCISLLKERV